MQAVASSQYHHHPSVSQHSGMLEALLDSFSGAVIVCEPGGRVEYANQAAEQQLCLDLQGHRLGLAGTGNGLRFKRAVRALRDAPDQPQGLELQIGGRPCIFQVSFLDGKQRWLRLVSCSALVAGTDPLALAAQQYRFTPAETDVASYLLQGKSANDIAAIRHSSRETVRSQIKSLLQKTGTRRQAALITLLGGY
ncbi:MAG: LuxR C-terminal-related transcriptional regulator [Pseudomonadales bacterium]|nr:LuxR C-terminal-related transcriptional regulator [Pseudomonadales bacterium]